MPRTVRSHPDLSPGPSSAELRAWVAYTRVQLRMNYEINRQLQRDSGLSLADYHVLNALKCAPGHKLQITDLAAMIGWERSRASHHLRRLCERGLTKRIQSEDDGRATDAVLTKKGMNAVVAAAPGHLRLVRTLFFDPLPRELISPFTAAMEHVQANLDASASLRPYPSEHALAEAVSPQGSTVSPQGSISEPARRPSMR
jgi:DNA-binding MarR family transcriptional regulator